MTDFDALTHLKSCSALSDSEIYIGMTALAAVMPDHHHCKIERYIRHLDKVSAQVGARYAALIEGGADDDGAVRIAALKHVLCDVHDYRLDDDEMEPLESADIMRVIDRGGGCSAALCVLYMNAARANSWAVEGLNFPSRFLLRLHCGGERIIFDPTQQCKILAAHDLRALVKSAMGDGFELSTKYYDGLDARATIIHLCNSLKLRRIEMGDYAAALALIERMRMIAPDEYRLLLDAGVLHMRLHQNGEAAVCLNGYIEKCDHHEGRYEAQILLRDLPFEE